MIILPAIPRKSERLDGPDLRNVATLAEQIASLDAARKSDVETYVRVWLEASDQNGGGASAFWAKDDVADAPARLMIGVMCDSQEDARRERSKALNRHHDEVAEFRAALQRELLSLGRYVDNRTCSPLELKAVVRAFLATGGRLLIAPKHVRRHGRQLVEVAPDTKRFLGDDWSEIDAIAAQAMCRLARRWRAQAALTRIIHKLGAAEDGWFVLTADGS